MNKDILDQYIYVFPYILSNSSKDSCTLMSSLSFQTYFKDSVYITIEEALKRFYSLFNRNLVIGQIVMFYEKNNDFICTIVNKLFPYIERY